ncbi:antibiotic biosynthesis monooxygenase family protein [Allopontixanthobacter sp.]|uniref:antibiotic biosynthesis monooxygenase family protein n=1 Tax=Allopontixanthobacter sp. TaxID=2906452 RepID=UPI002ABA992C|nr:antibiotic biosynthesis monooxygenase family protein [Allopontixanthobacter sp.]MDZ4308129.1 antibiotic biosynthesis monooxygenase family protein [Allopontixanthobacter sp.]
MIAVIFEVEPAAGLYDVYLDIAADLRPLLEKIEGFISVERFQSLSNPGKLVSLSFLPMRAQCSAGAKRRSIGQPSLPEKLAFSRTIACVLRTCSEITHSAIEGRLRNARSQDD